MIQIRFLRSALAAVLVAAGTLAAAADSSIRVVVNDKAITTFDISQRVKLMRIAAEKGGDKKAVEDLINETLELLEAAKRGVKVPDARVAGVYASIAQGLKLNAAGLDKALASEGIQPDTLKRRIRAQMAWQQVVQMKTRYEVSVKSSDVTAALFAEKPDKRMVTEFTLQQIIFVAPKGSSAAYIAQRRREAESFRQRYAGCEKAADQAKGLRDVAVKMLGRRTSAELVGKDGEDVQATPVAKASRPQIVASGIQLIGVCSAKKLSGDDSARSEIEDKMMFEKTKDIGADYIKELRSKAIIKYR